jgi:hypothetical protein
MKKYIAYLREKVAELNFNSKEYWEERYSGGGDSGAGSYGKMADFKAEIINNFIAENNISSAIEFGCGDGNQLEKFNMESYIGLDVSKTAIDQCLESFEGDEQKSFFLYDPEYSRDNHGIFQADLALSLEVIFHLTEDDLFEKYMFDLFDSAKEYVIIFSSNKDSNNGPPHVKHRNFTQFIDENLPRWSLKQKIENRYPEESFSSFYIYEKKN